MKQLKIILNYIYKSYLKIPTYLRGFVIFFILLFITILIKKYHKYQYLKNSEYIPTEQIFLNINSDNEPIETNGDNLNINDDTPIANSEGNINTENTSNTVNTIENKVENKTTNSAKDKINVKVKENLKSAPSLRKKNNEKLEDSTVLTDDEADYFFGDKKAPITIVEYSNFNCPYCIKFHEDNMEEIKKNYIDKGKVKYIKRIIIQKDTLIGIMLPYCAPQENKYLILNDLYEKVDDWTNTRKQNRVLKEIALNNGFTEQSYQSCIKNSVLANKLLQKQKNDLKELNIYSTPTIFINNKREKGSMSYKEFSLKIDKELEKVKK